MSLSTIVVILLVLVVIFGLPDVGTRVGYAHSYGYWPSGLGGILVIILLVLLLSGRL